MNYYASTYGALHKFVNSNGVWSQALTYPRAGSDFTYTAPSGTAVTPYGLKGVTGYRRATDNHLIIIVTTYHSTSCTATALNYCSAILSWDATNAGAGADVLVPPSAPEIAYFGVMWAPTRPSSSPTPTATSSPSQTQTPSNTPTPTASGEY